MNNSRRNKTWGAGFSLIEMLVVISIFLIVTSAILFNQNKYSSDISLSNVAYEIALQVRQAQVYGILVRENERIGEDDDFNSAYGLHFVKQGEDIVFQLFADDLLGDTDDLLVFDDGDRILSTHRLAAGNKIADVCTYGSGGSELCFSSDDDALTFADIVFKRPEPAAVIHDSSSLVRKNEINILVTSALGDKWRSIKVFGSGQISVYAN